MQTNVILRMAKDYNADPHVSPNLKFMTESGTPYKVGYVLVWPDGTAQYVKKLETARHELRVARSEWVDRNDAESAFAPIASAIAAL